MHAEISLLDRSQVSNKFSETTYRHPAVEFTTPAQTSHPLIQLRLRLHVDYTYLYYSSTQNIGIADTLTHPHLLCQALYRRFLQHTSLPAAFPTV